MIMANSRTTTFFTKIISFEDQVHIDRLRSFLNDSTTANILDGTQESSDEELWNALYDTLDEINYEFLPHTKWTIESIPSWNILKNGATLQVLTSKGILSARNTLTYNDSGGVTVQDMDKYGRYVNYFNVLINKYRAGVQSMKIGKNIEDAYGGVESEYASNRGSGNF